MHYVQLGLRGPRVSRIAFGNWSEHVTTDCLRSGIRMIAEREGYHARIFERRMKDLGIECKASASAEGKRITECLSARSSPTRRSCCA